MSRTYDVIESIVADFRHEVEGMRDLDEIRYVRDYTEHDQGDAVLSALRDALDVALSDIEDELEHCETCDDSGDCPFCGGDGKCAEVERAYVDGALDYVHPKECSVCGDTNDCEECEGSGQCKECDGKGYRRED